MKEAFCVDASHAALGRCHAGLAIVGVAYVASGKDTGNIRCAARILHLDVSCFVQFQLAIEEGRVG